MHEDLVRDKRLPSALLKTLPRTALFFVTQSHSRVPVAGVLRAKGGTPSTNGLCSRKKRQHIGKRNFRVMSATQQSFSSGHIALVLPVCKTLLFAKEQKCRVAAGLLHDNAPANRADHDQSYNTLMFLARLAPLLSSNDRKLYA